MQCNGATKCLNGKTLVLLQRDLITCVFVCVLKCCSTTHLLTFPLTLKPTILTALKLKLFTFEQLYRRTKVYESSFMNNKIVAFIS